MRISRHSMYDTFGDKRRLYLEALQQCGSSSTDKIISAMHRFTAFFSAEFVISSATEANAVWAMEDRLGVQRFCELSRYAR
jgi:TetR/AcrR family transcriptional regulator, transcriptional repressor for nem operon